MEIGKKKESIYKPDHAKKKFNALYICPYDEKNKYSNMMSMIHPLTAPHPQK